MLSRMDMNMCLFELGAQPIGEWSFVYSGVWTVPCNIAMKFLFEPSLILYDIDNEIYARYKTATTTGYWRYERYGAEHGLHMISSQFFTDLTWGGRICIFINTSGTNKDEERVQIDSCRNSIHTIRY